MLECNRKVRKKITLFTRVTALLVPVVCVILMMTQTAFAKNTYLINDGGRIMIHSTYATDPEQILDEAGLILGKDDTYTTQYGLEMSEIHVQRRQTVTVIYGDRTLKVDSYGENVDALLKRMDFRLTENDLVSQSLDTATYDGMVISISREVSQTETFVRSVPYQVRYCYDASLEEGEQKVLTEGVEGEIRYTADVHYVDGREISRVILDKVVLRPSVDALIAVGTYVEAPEYSDPMPEPEPTEPEPEPEPEPTVPETEPPVPQMTEPEKPALPVIQDGTIRTPDGEVLHYTGSMKTVATAYNKADPGCTDYTSIGTLCRVGAIAVDPKVIPIGTKMYIVSDDGAYIYGTAVAEDVGGAIKGNRIDLYFDTVEECIIFGIRDCTVYFLG